MAIFYKGAAPGTHWWRNDAREYGFSGVGAQPVNAASAIRHITAFSHPSPFVSLTASFDIARNSYAMAGPTHGASEDSPGYVYEIDTSIAQVELIDPIQLIVSQAGAPGSTSRLPHHHDGSADLILGIADPASHGLALVRPPARLGATNAIPPSVTPELHAVIFALRDAEVLALRIPRACVLGRHPVW